MGRLAGTKCEIVLACCVRLTQGSRLSDMFRSRHFAHALRYGQDRGVVTQSIESSASCAVREYRKQYGHNKGRQGNSVSSAASVRCCATQRQISHQKSPVRRDVPKGPSRPADRAPYMGNVRMPGIVCHYDAGPAGLQTAGSI